MPHTAQEPVTVSFAAAALIVFFALAYGGWVMNIQPARADRALSDADDLRQHIGEVEPNEALGAATETYRRALDFPAYGRGTVQKSLAAYAP